MVTKHKNKNLRALCLKARNSAPAKLDNLTSLTPPRRRKHLTDVTETCRQHVGGVLCEAAILNARINENFGF